jgi:hypothetical protein
MSNGSGNDLGLWGSSGIVSVFSQRRLQRVVRALEDLIADADYPISAIRVHVSDAYTAQGEPLIGELQAMLEQGNTTSATNAVLLLKLLGNQPAKVALWAAARDRQAPPWLRLETLRALKQLGEPVALRELIALANLCEGVIERDSDSE